MNKMSVTLAAAALLAAVRAVACDVCAVHVTHTPASAAGRFNVSVFEQYSTFDPTSEEPEAFSSYTTQFGVGYRIDDRWSLQLGVPYLDRKLDEREEDGVGDLTAVAVFRVHTAADDKGIRTIDVFAGLKAPTGNTDPLAEDAPIAIDAEEAGHDHEHADGEEEHSHGDGHHLSLGSGSWDGLVGLHAVHAMSRFQGLVDAQYAIKTEGDYDYEYGDEFTWRIGGQFVLIPDGQKLLTAGVDVSGEISGDNTVRGETVEDTGKTATYVGPALTFAFKERLNLMAAVDFPIQGGDEGVHGAADERVRASLSFLF